MKLVLGVQKKKLNLKTTTEHILPYHLIALEGQPLEEKALEKQVLLHKMLMNAVKYGTIQDIQSILSANPEVLQSGETSRTNTNTCDTNSQEFIRSHRVNATVVNNIPDSVLLSPRDHRLMSLEYKSSKGTTISSAVDANDLSICHWAALRTDTALDLLLKHGAQETSNQYGVTALHLAATRGNANNIATLLEIPADVQERIEATTNGSETATCTGEHLINENSGVPIIKRRRKYSRGDKYRFYIQLDFDVALIPGATALHLASYYAHPACVSMLLAAGADPCALDAYGRTPLDVAGEGHIHDEINPNSFEEVIKVLLTVNSPKTFGEKNGFGSALHTAITLNSVKSLWLLLKAGMPVTSKNEFGATPLFWCISEKRAEHLKILLQVKCDDTAIRPVDNTYADNCTLLHMTILTGWELGVRIALAAGAHVTAQDLFGNTPIHFAARLGSKEILDEVITAVKDKNAIDIVNNKNKTPLFYAVRYGNIECVKRILEEDPNIALVNLDGYNVFHTAAKIRRFDIFRILYNHDKELVKIEKNQVKGPCVMDIAIESGCSDIINWLLNKSDAVLSVDRLRDILNRAPNPTELMEKFFDDNIIHDKTKADPDCTVTLYYNVVLSGSAEEQMEFIKSLIATGNRYGQKNLLTHPLVESFLHLKWKALSLFFGIIFIIYAIFVMSLTLFIISKFGYKDINEVPTMLNPTAWAVILYITLIFIFLQEIHQLRVIVAPLRRFLLFETWVKLVSLCLSALLPPLLSSININDVEWPRHVASIAVLFSWFQMMFFLSRIPKLGFIVLMFGNVACHVIKILFTFIFLIFGFTLSFTIKFNYMPPFENLGSAFIKILVMMSSEFDYGDLTEENTTEEEMSSKNNTGRYQEIAKDFVPSIGAVQLMFIAFWFFVAIVLMNLMIGVAVDNIQYLEKMGHGMRLEKQVEVLASLESLFHRNIILTRKLPRYMSRISKEHAIMTFYPNNLSHESNKRLPRYLREAVLQKAKFLGNLYIDKYIKYQPGGRLVEKNQFIMHNKEVDHIQQEHDEGISKKFDELAMRIDKSNHVNERNSYKIENIVGRIDQQEQMIKDKFEVIVNQMDKLECKFTEVCSKIDLILQLNKTMK